jgi:hypothetical protein
MADEEGTQVADPAEEGTAVTDPTPAPVEDAPAEETVLGGEEESSAPEKYELTLPEETLLDAEATERVAAFAREHKLSNEHAQELVQREHDAVQAYADAFQANVDAEAAKWLDQAKADPEIGGESFNENVELAKRVVDRFGDDDFKRALNKSRLGNHPALLRFVVGIGKGMSEDSFVKPGAQAKEDKPIEEIFYGSPDEET